MLRYGLAAASVGLFLGMAAMPSPAKAELLASGLRVGQCISMNGNSAVLAGCSTSSNQNFRFRSGQYGEILINGLCLSSSGNGNALQAQSCRGGTNQKWIVTSDGSLRNEDGYCADIEREGGSGSRIIGYTCTQRMNQKWGWSRLVSASQASLHVPLNARTVDQLRSARPGTAANGSGIVSTGARVVAVGGGNVVAVGGGNVLVPVSGVVAAGGLN